MQKILIKRIDARLGKAFPLPHYATADFAGLAVCACTNDILNVNPGETILILVGFAIHIANKHYAAMLLPRSDLGYKI